MHSLEDHSLEGYMYVVEKSVVEKSVQCTLDDVKKEGMSILI